MSRAPCVLVWTGPWAWRRLYGRSRHIIAHKWIKEGLATNNRREELDDTVNEGLLLGMPTSK